jgi:hypothetical protein
MRVSYYCHSFDIQIFSFSCDSLVNFMIHLVKVLKELRSEPDKGGAVVSGCICPRDRGLS